MCGLANCAPVVLDSYFRPDVPFPQHSYLWKDSAKLGENIDLGPLGGTLQIYVRNTGRRDLRPTDVLLDGVSLTKAIAFSHQRKFRKHAYAANVHFSAISAADKAKLTAAGEPVWWRMDPALLKPGQCGELIIRLRHKPDRDVGVTLISPESAPLAKRIRVNEIRPRLETIAFSPEHTTVYLYVSREPSGHAPSRVLMDGIDITSKSIIAVDPTLGLAPVVCRLTKPLERGSIHCFQIKHQNGSGVTAAARVWADDFSYGMWGAPPSKKNDSEPARKYFEDLALHNINTQMEQIGSEAVRSYMVSPEGVKLLRSLGIRRMVSDPGKDKSGSPWAYFLMDEPDAGDASVKDLPGNSRVGALAQGILERSAKLRQSDPHTPQLLNVDMTFKPQNWYTYGQIPDILTADPYYQVRLAEAYSSKPERIPVFAKADFVYAVNSVIASSHAPRPINCVLYAGTPADESKPFRFGTPEEKRIEAYYSIAAGARGISYWWFHSLAKGLEAKNALATTQWLEMGLLGAELRTAGPLIMRSCPIALPISATDKLWTRSLACGTDTLLILCVNDDYSNNREGTRIDPIANASLTVTLPNWFGATEAFEISYNGTRDIKWTRSGSQADLALGRVNVTRMVVITSDSSLRPKLQKLYDTQFKTNVNQLSRQTVIIL